MRHLPNIDDKTFFLFLAEVYKLFLLFSLFAGRTLSVTWSLDGNRIYSGSSDGYAMLLI